MYVLTNTAKLFWWCRLWFHQLLLKEMWPLMTLSKYTRSTYQRLINVKKSLFDGKEDGVSLTFLKARRPLRKHWNSVIARHTQIFSPPKNHWNRCSHVLRMRTFWKCFKTSKYLSTRINETRKIKWTWVDAYQLWWRNQCSSSYVNFC